MKPKSEANATQPIPISNPDQFAKLWQLDEMKYYLVMQIKEKKKKGEISNNKKITEKELITEYWRYWFSIEEKDKTKQLVSYPGLTQQDYDEISTVISSQKEKQFYWALGMTGINLGFYSLFFSKFPLFYGFFRKKHKYRAINWMKRGFSCFSLFVGWIVFLNFFFNKTIPSELNNKGLFKKYGIEYEFQNL